jgi:hypothetical protein
VNILILKCRESKYAPFTFAADDLDSIFTLQLNSVIRIVCTKQNNVTLGFSPHRYKKKSVILQFEYKNINSKNKWQQQCITIISFPTFHLIRFIIPWKIHKKKRTNDNVFSNNILMSKHHFSIAIVLYIAIWISKYILKK